MVVKVYLVDYTSPFSLINTRFFCSIWSSLVCLCRGLFKKSGGNLLAELTFGVWLVVNTPAINRLPFPWLRINCRWEWCSIFSYQITIILLESCAFVYYPLATWRFSSRTRWRQQSRVSHMPSSWWKREPCLIHTGHSYTLLYTLRILQIFLHPQEMLSESACLVCRACSHTRYALYCTYLLHPVTSPYHRSAMILFSFFWSFSFSETFWRLLFFPLYNHLWFRFTEDANTRTIWGKTFQLEHCSRCGAVIGTREQIEEAARRSGNEPEYLCETCRKERMAKFMADTFGFDIS